MARPCYGTTPDYPRDGGVLECKGSNVPNESRPTRKYRVRSAAGTYLVQQLCGSSISNRSSSSSRYTISVATACASENPSAQSYINVLKVAPLTGAAYSDSSMNQLMR